MTLPSFTYPIISLDAVDSTNNFAANLLKTSNPENGTVILTKSQTKGRGQRQNRWFSEPGKNLTFSLILYSNLNVKDSFYLNKIISIALIQFLKEKNVEAKIKWPNDIYVGEKKIAGILIENSILGDKIKNSIIGVGLNMNQDDFAGLKATSVFTETKTNFDIKLALHEFLAHFQKCWYLLQINNKAQLDKAYLAALFGLNELLKFNDAEGDFQGQIKGLTKNGQLIIEKRGESVHYNFKEVSFLL